MIKEKVILIFCLRRPLSLKNGQMRPQNSFLQFPQKILLSPKKLFNIKIFSIKFSIKKVTLIFSIRWRLLLKNGHVPAKFFSPIFSQNVPFYGKIVKWKNIQNFISHKRGYIHFRRQMPPLLHKRLGPQKRFFVVLSEN